MLWLGCESQINDRQVLPTRMIAYVKANGCATVAGHRCVRRCAWRTARPSRARFVSRALTRRQHIMIDLMRCLATERRPKDSVSQDTISASSAAVTRSIQVQLRNFIRKFFPDTPFIPPCIYTYWRSDWQKYVSYRQSQTLPNGQATYSIYQ